MIDALVYLIDSLLTAYLYLLILRFVMQLVRADFRNQFAHFVVVVTNPVIMPLRRILPPVGKIDTASVLAIVLVAALTIGAITLLTTQMLLDPLSWVLATARMLLRAFLVFFMGAIFVYALLSWVVPAGYNPVMSLLGAVCEPVLRPIRRLIPQIGGLDLSALWALLVLGVVLRLFHFT
jgi:YggT family protein